jgi:hypothetical protein
MFVDYLFSIRTSPMLSLNGNDWQTKGGLDPFEQLALVPVSYGGSLLILSVHRKAPLFWGIVQKSQHPYHFNINIDEGGGKHARKIWAVRLHIGRGFARNACYLVDSGASTS